MKHSIAERVGQCGANLGSSGSPKAKWNKCGEQATSHAASFVPHFCSPSTATTFLHAHYYSRGGWRSPALERRILRAKMEQTVPDQTHIAVTATMTTLVNATSQAN